MYQPQIYRSSLLKTYCIKMMITLNKTLITLIIPWNHLHHTYEVFHIEVIGVICYYNASTYPHQPNKFEFRWHIYKIMKQTLEGKISVGPINVTLHAWIRILSQSVLVTGCLVFPYKSMTSGNVEIEIEWLLLQEWWNELYLARIGRHTVYIAASMVLLWNDRWNISQD